MDLGANIGATSLSLAAHGWKGYAFEASARNASLLKKSAEINDFQIAVRQTAVYSKSGEIYFSQDGPWGLVQTEYNKSQGNFDV